MDYWHPPTETARTPEERRDSVRIQLAGIVFGLGLGTLVFLFVRHPEWSLIATVRGWFGLLP
jgi:hypothetical protein